MIGNQPGTELLQGAAGEFVFKIEVGRDDEKAVVREAVEGAVEHALPEIAAVPEVLVAEKGDVEIIGAGHAVEEGEAVTGVERGPEVGVRSALPTGPGFVDLRGAKIRADDFERLAFGTEEVGQDSGFVGAPAGEVEQALVPVGGGEGFLERCERAFEGLPEVSQIPVRVLKGVVLGGNEAHLADIKSPE